MNSLLWIPRWIAGCCAVLTTITATAAEVRTGAFLGGKVVGANQGGPVSPPPGELWEVVYVEKDNNPYYTTIPRTGNPVQVNRVPLSAGALIDSSMGISQSMPSAGLVAVVNVFKAEEVVSKADVVGIVTNEMSKLTLRVDDLARANQALRAELGANYWVTVRTTLTNLTYGLVRDAVAAQYARELEDIRLRLELLEAKLPNDPDLKKLKEAAKSLEPNDTTNPPNR